MCKRVGGGTEGERESLSRYRSEHKPSWGGGGRLIPMTLRSYPSRNQELGSTNWAIQMPLYSFSLKIRIFPNWLNFKPSTPRFQCRECKVIEPYLPRTIWLDVSWILEIATPFDPTTLLLKDVFSGDNQVCCRAGLLRLNVQTISWVGLLLKCRLWFSRYGKVPRFPHFQLVPDNVEAAGS